MLGVKALWRGHMATIMRIFPHSGISYMTFARAEDAIQQITGQEKKTPLTRLVAGAVAGSTATCFSYPFDLLRARMAAHYAIEAPYKTGYGDAIRDVVAKEGPLALYHGIKPTLLGVVPYAGLSFMVFETNKASNAIHHTLPSSLPAHPHSTNPPRARPPCAVVCRPK